MQRFSRLEYVFIQRDATSQTYQIARVVNDDVPGQIPPTVSVKVWPTWNVEEIERKRVFTYDDLKGLAIEKEAK